MWKGVKECEDPTPCIWFSRLSYHMNKGRVRQGPNALGHGTVKELMLQGVLRSWRPVKYLCDALSLSWARTVGPSTKEKSRASRGHEPSTFLYNSSHCDQCQSCQHVPQAKLLAGSLYELASNRQSVPRKGRSSQVPRPIIVHLICA